MIVEVFNIFIDVVTPVFALVLLGYFCGPRLQLEARTLSRAAYFAFIPAFVFNTISQVRIELSLILTMVSYILLVHGSLAILGFTVAKIMRRSKEVTAAFVMIAVFGNVGNFGLSLINFRLGEEAQVPATVYFLAILMIAFVICVGVAGWTKGGGLHATISVFKTPALIAFVPAAFFAYGDIPVPLFIGRATGLLGDAMIPTMLFTLGVQLAEVKGLKFSRDVLAASMVRLLGGPALAVLLIIPFQLNGLERGAGILQSSMPAAILTSIIAIEYDIVPEFVTTTVLFSTLASLFTLTVVLSLV